MKTEIDSKVFRKALVQYPYNSESSGSYLTNITSVTAFETEKGAEVVIKTHLPGILIGKQGIQISEIRELMCYMSKMNVEINIVEEDMFQGLYG